MALGWPMMPQRSRSLTTSSIFSLVATTVAFTIIISGRIASAEEPRPLVSLNIQTDQVFSLFLTPQYFNWTHTEGEVTYRPSSLGQPALPGWLRHRPLPERRAALLYGRPPLAGLTQLQVVVTDRHTFKTGLLAVDINVEEAVNDNFEVNLKINNLNIEDIFDWQRMERLKKVFQNNLWQESHEDLRLTYADSVPQLGGRKPLNPNLKDGVVIRLASSSNFSLALEELDRETQPLRRLSTCSFKRVSVERFLRQAGFAVDWCAFRLIKPGPQVIDVEDDLEDLNVDTRPAFKFPQRGSIERRAMVKEMLTAAVIPLLIFLVFSSCLGCILFTACGEEKQRGGLFIESLFEVFDDCCVYKDTTQLLIANNNNNNSVATGSVARSMSPLPNLDPLPSRSSSIQRQTETLRSLGRRRDVTPRLQASPPPANSAEVSSLVSRSRTTSPAPVPASPTGTLRQSLDWEMFESLNRPDPPAYGSLPRTGAR